MKQLYVGTKLSFADSPNEYTVTATHEMYVACTRPSAIAKGYLTTVVNKATGTRFSKYFLSNDISVKIAKGFIKEVRELIRSGEAVFQEVTII